MYVYIYICICMCVYIYIYILCICIYLNIYIYNEAAGRQAAAATQGAAQDARELAADAAFVGGALVQTRKGACHLDFNLNRRYARTRWGGAGTSCLRRVGRKNSN
jgi:hypothetical protein